MSARKRDALLGRKYPITLHEDESGGYVAEPRDLPGCITQGETLDEAVANLDSARRLWLRTAMDHGDAVPLPSTDETYSGRVLVRMPRSLHRRLAEAAEREGTSLNQVIVSMLSSGVTATQVIHALQALTAQGSGGGAKHPGMRATAPWPAGSHG